ncbi:MAG: TonB-dependent receptor plug domain-containing protein [Methylophilaceae bacterium]|nr:TonB-dependent receptor plug domain-containing protein [Methylophilaceae bacterium]
MKKNFKVGLHLFYAVTFLSINNAWAEVNISADVIKVESPLKMDNMSLGKTLEKKQIVRSAVDSSDAGSLLNYFVGTNNISNAGASGMPVIHGLADDRIKVRVDGVDLISGCASHSNSPFSYIDINNVDEIKVFAGITPVSMGGDSIGGTVIVNSKAPEYSESSEVIKKGSFGTIYRSNNQSFGTNINTAIATDRFSIKYSGNYIDAKNYSSAANFKAGANVSGRGWIDGDIAGSSAYKISNHLLDFGLKKGSSEFNLKLYEQHSPYQGLINQRMDMTGNDSTSLNLMYIDQFSWGDMEARAYIESTDHSMNFGPDKKYWYSNNAAGNPMDSEGLNVGFTVKADISLDEKNILTVGSEFQRYRLDDLWAASGTGSMSPNTFININNGARDRYDVYAELTHSWQPDFLTSVGLRYGMVRMDAGEVHGYADVNTFGGMTNNQKSNSAAFNASERTKIDHNWDLTILSEYIISPKYTSEFGYAIKNRSPNLYERYTWSTWIMAANMNNSYGDGNGYIGNINLSPETAHTISWSSKWHDYKKQEYQVKFNPYFTYVNDYIDAVACSVVGKSCMSRSDGFSTLSLDNQSARIYGFNISGFKNLGYYKNFGDIKVTGSLAYVRGRNNNTHDNLYRIMPLNLKLALEQISGSWRNNLELVAVKRKGRVSSIRNEHQTPGYSLVNIASNYSYMDATFNMSLTNLFDRKYSDPLGGTYIGQGATMMTGVNNGVAVPGMGRSINVGVLYNF